MTTQKLLIWAAGLTYRDNAECTKLAVGESADFAVVDKNILKDDHDLKVLSVYIKGRKRD